jgi:DNA-binding response OmpR family regulator
MAPSMKLLVVEDDRKLGQFIRKGLEEQAYTAVWVGDMASAREVFYRDDFDVVILDIGLPDGNGLALLREIRAGQGNCSVIILSARGDVDDRVTGLNLGADDYLSKPFSFAELLARVRSLTRRHDRVRRTVLQGGRIRMDLVTREVTMDGRRVELSQREYALLEYLLQNTGRVLTRTQIAEKIWDCHFDMETNLIDVYVRKLRNKLVRDDDTASLIQTVRGVGYCLR